MEMKLDHVLRMNGGEGKTSYANNSSFQKLVILKAKPFIEESITELLSQHTIDESKYLKIADLGCSSGPNTLLPTWEIIDIIDNICYRRNQKQPYNIQVFLNDLMINDFNTVFKALPHFYERLEKEKGRKAGTCFVASMPGSFYGRLFPDRSIHFMHSSYSLHWFSQIPRGLVSEMGVPLNKGTICVAKTSPPIVHKVYLDQFQEDFTTFLRCRSEEMFPGGHLVLSLIGKNDDEDGNSIEELIGMSIYDMVMEGSIEAAKLDGFNIPFYPPNPEEVRKIVETEGSFKLLRLERYKLRRDAAISDGNEGLVFDMKARGKHVAMELRAVFEPLLLTHFQDAIIDQVFDRFAIKATENLRIGKCILTTLTVSLSKTY